MRSVPLLVLVLLTATPALAELDSFGLGTGRDGALTVNTPGRVVNPSVPLAANAPAGSSVLRVERAISAASGALVLIHQSMGLPADTPSGSTGAITPNTVGHWELARVETVTSTNPPEMVLTAPLANRYTVPGAQVVVMPEYTSVTVSASGSIVAPPWDGSSGGIVAFLVTGTLTNQGLISADGAGFRGGAFVNHPETYACTGLDVPAEQGGAYKGEGLVVSRYGEAAGRGNLANGGGGGNCHNSGGGGGGHNDFGGTGGKTSDSDDGRDEGGLGGVAVRYSLYYQFVFGGGGGAGEGNNDAGSGGGAGGGVVFIRANAVTGAAGRFSANGQSGPDAPKDDGAGGGGAGGAIILRAAGAVACSGALARGGNGGSVTDPGFLMGPGGGGSGGGVLMQGTSLNCASSVTGGLPGSVAASDAGSYGAGSGGGGVAQILSGGFRTPTTPTITAPVAGAVGVSSRPRIEGTGDPGLRIIVFIDDVELVQVSVAEDGRFGINYPSLRDPLTSGEHKVTAVADGLGAYSARSSEVTFGVAVTLADGGVLLPPILVVPEDGEVVGPTPLFAGVAPNGPTVGIEVDNGPEVTLNVDEFGRFRYQWPAETPLAPGPHFVTVHVHNEAGETGPYSPVTRFESLEADAGTPDSGSPDAGSGGTDAGSDAGSTGDAGTQGAREVPVLVLPAEGEVVDSTPLFAGVAAPGASVSIEVDGAELVQVTADTTGAFRHLVTSEKALPTGAHSVTAHAVVSAAAGPRSPATGFEVRGPANLDVGCGCGASPAGAVGLWALLAGLATAARRRRR